MNIDAEEKRLQDEKAERDRAAQGQPEETYEPETGGGFVSPGRWRI